MIATATYTAGRPVGVDREAAVVRGVVMATAGIFKSRRGQFDLDGLKNVLELAAAEPLGLRSFFKHPTEFEPDPLDRFLGRIKDPYMSTVTVLREGRYVKLDAVRGDLHLSPVSLKVPPGGGTPYGEFVLELAAADPDALGASLALRATKAQQLNARGRPATDEDGQLLPPLWTPIAIESLDIVAAGDATSGLLSVVDDHDQLFAHSDPCASLLGSVADYRPAVPALPDIRLVRVRWRNRKRKAGVL